MAAENNDNTLERIPIRLELAPQHALESLAMSSWMGDGFRRATMPNQIYRRTKREAGKTGQPSKPAGEHFFRCPYNYRLVHQRLAMSTSSLRRFVRRVFCAAALAERSARRQCNEFGNYVFGTERYQPGLHLKGEQLAPDVENISSICRGPSHGRT